MKRWPLFLIAAPAAVAVWSGWVGLGQLCGFGPVDLLPGIAHLTVNTAITLPVGVEAYGAYALGAWLAPGEVEPGSRAFTARRFARRSAIGALALGMLGQVVYHLLAAAGATRAPWPAVVLVSCLPVVTLGFGAALTHLLRAPVPNGTASRTDSGRGDQVFQMNSVSNRTGTAYPPYPGTYPARIRTGPASTGTGRPRPSYSPLTSRRAGSPVSALSALACTSASPPPSRYRRT